MPNSGKNSEFLTPSDHKTGFSSYDNQPYQRGTQERLGSFQIHSGFENDKSGDQYRQIQNGNYSKGTEVFKEGDVQNRPEKGLFSRSNLRSRSQSPRIQVLGKDIRVHMSGLWFKQGPKSFHEDPERSNAKMEENGNNSVYLHRRHIGPWFLQRRNPPEHLKGLS